MKTTVFKKAGTAAFAVALGLALCAASFGAMGEYDSKKEQELDKAYDESVLKLQSRDRRAAVAREEYDLVHERVYTPSHDADYFYRLPTTAKVTQAGESKTESSLAQEQKRVEGSFVNSLTLIRLKTVSEPSSFAIEIPEKFVDKTNLALYYYSSDTNHYQPIEKGDYTVKNGMITLETNTGGYVVVSEGKLHKN